MPDSERVEEPPLTYTQGTFGEACRQLYHITGEKIYMNKAVLIPYAVNLVLDESADKASRKVIREKLMLCAETLDAHLDRNLYPQMYCNYFWARISVKEQPQWGHKPAEQALLKVLPGWFLQ